MADVVIKWAVEYPATLFSGSQSNSYSERVTSPPFDTKDAAQELARALLNAYREVELHFLLDGAPSHKKSFQNGPPGTMNVLVKPVLR